MSSPHRAPPVDAEPRARRPSTVVGAGGRLRALDGVRGLAVLAVLFFHAGMPWAHGGFLGVDTFFVLSGYLITVLLLREWRETGGVSLRRFWARRARRLLPALLLVLAALAAYAATLPTEVRPRLRGDALATLGYVANWRFIFSGQSYFDQFSQPSPLRHMWSLAIEEQFYLVWPLVVFACLRLGRGRRRILVGVAAAGVVVSTLVMAALYDSTDPSRAYYGTDSRMHTILI
ncbi:MAG TPA: acyltransferase, partial [Mycobacteriales bacterium]|nr:acyltransferase [Mycobacteriales bacterium]